LVVVKPLPKSCNVINDTVNSFNEGSIVCWCAKSIVSRCVVHFTLRRGDKVTRAVLRETAPINNNNNQLYSMKCMIIPVIIGAFGTVTNVLQKHMEAIPGKHSIV